MEIKKGQLMILGFAIVFIIVSLIAFKGSNALFLMVGIGIIIALTPFVMQIVHENKANTEKEEMFLEFARNLVESVKTGTPISKSILNIKDKSYGVLSDNIKKLANQISLGIPLNTALKVFSQDVGNRSISRSLTLIGQAERAGGEIGEILEAVAEAVTVSDKLKKERKAAISTLVVQGYIIFFVFMIIVLVMQFQILPMVSGIADVGSIGIGSIGAGGSAGGEIDSKEIADSFLYLLLVQGFFTGLTIGKLSEGDIKAGIKHSFALMLTSFLVSAAANIFMG